MLDKLRGSLRKWATCSSINSKLNCTQLFTYWWDVEENTHLRSYQCSVHTAHQCINAHWHWKISNGYVAYIYTLDLTLFLFLCTAAAITSLHSQLWNNTNSCIHVYYWAFIDISIGDDKVIYIGLTYGKFHVISVISWCRVAFH